MARKPKIQCRIERDTDDAIQRYRDDLDDDVSQSEAVRHLLRAGLAAKGHPVAAPDGRFVEDTLLERLASRVTVLAGTLLLVAGIVLLAATGLFVSGGTLELALATLGISAVLLVAGTAVIAIATLANFALARPLRALALATDTDTT